MKRRLDDLLAGRKLDRVPCMPILTVGYSSRSTGMSLEELYRDAKKCVRAQILTAEMHDYDPLPMYLYAAFGAWEFGGQVEIPSDKGLAPWVTKTPIEKPEDVGKLEIPDVKSSGSMPLVLEAARESTRQKYPAIFPSGGLLTWTLNVIGIERGLRWMVREPDLVHEVLRKVSEFSIIIAEHLVNEFGPEVCLPVDLSPSEANTLISPQYFRDFFLPYTLRVHKRILKMGVPRFLVHICGEQNKNLECWKMIPNGEPGMVHFGHQIDIETAKEILGNENIIMGNLNTTSIMVYPFEKVLELSKEAIEKGKDAPRGFIVSPGCEPSPQTPPVNIYAMIKASRESGKS